MSDAPDLNTPRLLTEDEVAKLFHITIRVLRYRITNGKFPIRPKVEADRLWSATELRDWFEDARRRA